jgi:hypothetical protein
MKKLICDKCSKEIISPGDIDLVIAGMKAWQDSVRARGEEPRGVFPCENYVRCGGEMVIIEDNTDSDKHKKLKKLFRL